ncbi:hypothetical protein I316_04359 [Kwoniella heveanensis BCC8398]|uniref:Uncharacterized protein n=1 Tax=Kwoniella heveanensis BCC8398 TaxID=1296120 RepID=A0A1B9GSM4_9TREE|nr:hypothetical protein I316_04359 [Kwoniella heveanensis BCC8398]
MSLRTTTAASTTPSPWALASIPESEDVEEPTANLGTAEPDTIRCDISDISGISEVRPLAAPPIGTDLVGHVHVNPSASASPSADAGADTSNFAGSVAAAQAGSAFESIPPESRGERERERRSILFYAPRPVALSTDPNFHPDGPYDSHVHVGSSPTARSDITAYKGEFTARLKEWHRSLHRHYDQSSGGGGGGNDGPCSGPQRVGAGFWGNLKGDISKQSARIVDNLSKDDRFRDCTAVEVDNRVLEALKRIDGTIADDESQGCLILAHNKGGAVDLDPFTASTGKDQDDDMVSGPKSKGSQRRSSSLFSDWLPFMSRRKEERSKQLQRAFTFPPSVDDTGSNTFDAGPNPTSHAHGTSMGHGNEPESSYPGAGSCRVRTYVRPRLSHTVYVAATSSLQAEGATLLRSIDERREQGDTQPLKAKELRALMPKRQVAQTSVNGADDDTLSLETPHARIVPAWSVVTVRQDVWDKLGSIEGFRSIGR